MNLLFIEFDFGSFIIMIGTFIIMYFWLIKPQQKKAKEQANASIKQTEFNTPLSYKCPFCNNIISIKDVFCTHCGNKLPNNQKEKEVAKVCPKCNMTLGENDKFCYNCGEAVP